MQTYLWTNTSILDLRASGESFKMQYRTSIITDHQSQECCSKAVAGSHATTHVLSLNINKIANATSTTSHYGTGGVVGGNESLILMPGALARL